MGKRKGTSTGEAKQRAAVSSRRSGARARQAPTPHGCGASIWFAQYLISTLNPESLTAYFSSPGPFPAAGVIAAQLTHKRLWKGMKRAILQSPLMQARLDADVYRP